MDSPTRYTRTNATYSGQVSPQSFASNTLNQTGQSGTLFRDPLHVQHWVATSGNTPVDSGSLISSPRNERIATGDGLPEFFSHELQGPSMGLATLNCDSDLYATNVSPVMPTTQVYFQGNSIVDDNGSSHGIVSPTEMSYAASIHALTFNDEYHRNGETTYSPEAPQMAWSASTEWPSPSSLATEPSYINCYTTPGSLPCVVNSPPMISVSEDGSTILGVDEFFPTSIGTSCMQYPMDGFQPDLSCPELGTGDVHSVDMAQNIGSSRPLTEYAYTTITDPALWLPYGQTGGNARAPHRAIQPLTNANARAHPFYHMGPSQDDNLYHCPLIDCGHKPDKLKCNYDKHLDSHLKPYRCKYRSCSSIHFSSTACLLRHEREAHGMHGHGNDPFQCHYPGCDRGRGFPRRYNLEDHMRRMHKHEPSPTTRRRSTTAAEGTKSAPARSARRNTLDTVNELTRPERSTAQSRMAMPQSMTSESRTRISSGVRKRTTKVESRRKRVR